MAHASTTPTPPRADSSPTWRLRSARTAAARGVATRALAARLPHTEAAGLLAEAVGDTPLVLVVDEVERIAEEPEALAVVAALVRYARACDAGGSRQPPRGGRRARVGRGARRNSAP